MDDRAHKVHEAHDSAQLRILLQVDLHTAQPGKAEPVTSLRIGERKHAMGEPKGGDPNLSHVETIENKDANPLIASNSNMASNRKEDEKKRQGLISVASIEKSIPKAKEIPTL